MRFYYNNKLVLEIETNKINIIFNIKINSFDTENTIQVNKYIIKRKYLDIINIYNFDGIIIDFSLNTSNYVQISYFYRVLLITLEKIII